MYVYMLVAKIWILLLPSHRKGYSSIYLYSYICINKNKKAITIWIYFFNYFLGILCFYRFRHMYIHSLRWRFQKSSSSDDPVTVWTRSKREKLKFLMCGVYLQKGCDDGTPFGKKCNFVENSHTCRTEETNLLIFTYLCFYEFDLLSTN